MGLHAADLAEARARQHDLFIERLAVHGRITQAAREAGLSREAMYATRDRDKEFAERWAVALETYADRLEEAAFERAVEGTEKGVWHQGVLVGKERQYSDVLLIALLKAKRAREFGDRSKLEMSGPDGGPLQVETSSSLDLARKVGHILAKGLAAKEQQAAAEPTDGSDLA